METTVNKSSIMEAMQKAIEEMPEENKGRFAMKITVKDVEASFTYKYKDLEAGAYVSKTWNGKVDAGGKVTWSF